MRCIFSYIGESKADRDDSAMQSVVLRLARSVLRILERLLKKAEQIKRSVEQAALLTPALVRLVPACFRSLLAQLVATLLCIERLFH